MRPEDGFDYLQDIEDELRFRSRMKRRRLIHCIAHSIFIIGCVTGLVYITYLFLFR
jgi:hypothetical protein